MRRNRRRWSQRVLSAALALLLAPTLAPADEPRSSSNDSPRSAPSAADAPVNLFLGTPADLDDLLKALARPDFVLLRGDEYARLRSSRAEATTPATSPLEYAVGSVTVTGSVAGDLADLMVRLRVSVASDGSVWVPIRLDGLTLTGVSEGEDPLPVRSADGGVWQVEVSGRGAHTLRAGVLLPVKTTAEGRGVDLTIPEAPSTRLDVVVPGVVSGASAGPGEPVGHARDGKNAATRLTAELPPRSKLALAWRPVETNPKEWPPLLVAQGEIAVELEPGTFRTRSTWSVRSARGKVEELQISLDPRDEVVEVDLDGRKPLTHAEPVGDVVRLTVPLTDPLGPGQERRLVMTTRRAIASGSISRVSYRGFPLLKARDQTGAIGVTPTGNLWVTGVAGHGIRQIDPRTELPADLRARPATELAYQFSEQPFDLALRIESSPPTVRAESRTTVTLGPRSAWVDTWLDFESARGKLLDLTLGLPPGLEVDSVGPPEVVGTVNTGALPGVFLPEGVGGIRWLHVRFREGGQEEGRFALHVSGRQAIDTSGPEVEVGLFQPVGVTTAGGRIAVLTDPALSADPADGLKGRGTFRPAQASPPANWPWPAGKEPTVQVALWLRHDDSPAILPLAVSAHTPSLSTSTSLRIRVDGRGAGVQQETEVFAKFGSFTRLDVEVPPGITGPLDLADSAVSDQREVGRTPGGGRLVRLTLAAELTRSLRLQFRYRVSPESSPPSSTSPFDLKIPWVSAAAGVKETTPARVFVVPAVGLTVASIDPAWVEEAAAGESGENEAGGLVLVHHRPRDGAAGETPISLNVRPQALTKLPGTVVPRLALRTAQGTDGQTRTRAWYRVETREPFFDFKLPAASELTEVRVDGESARQVETLPQGAGFRIAFPGRGGGPVSVELAYVVRGGPSGTLWQSPRLTDDAVVQQTLWEVEIPRSRTLLGTPPGWSDENEWYWDYYVFKRRPSRGFPPLSDWVSGATEPARPAARGSVVADVAGDDHAYLFGRPGGPEGLSLWVVPRAWLVAVCSGTVLAAGGVLILAGRPDSRPLRLAATALVPAFAALVQPDVTFVAAQSGAVGVVLTALLALMQGSFGNRGSNAKAHDDEGKRPHPGAATGSTLSRDAAPGSDDSTAIRGRPNTSASTMDHVYTIPLTEPGTNPPKKGPVPESKGRGGSTL